MRELIQKYFKIGTLQWMSHPNREVVQSVYDLACDPFFEAIELPHIPDEVRGKVSEILKQSHMTVGYGTQPMQLGEKLNPNALDETERLRCEKRLIEALEEAHELHAEGISMMAGHWDEEHMEEAYGQLKKTVEAVCKEAAPRGMKVELEVFDYDMDKAVLIGPAPLAAKFAADIRCKYQNFGLLVDLSHIPTTHEKPRDVIRTLRPYLTHFHIGNAVVKADCEAYGDKHPSFGFPESANDTEQLTEFFQILKEENFFDAMNPYILSIEVKPWKDEDENLILAATKRVIMRAWAMVED